MELGTQTRHRFGIGTRLAQLAVAGNACVLVLIVIVACQADRLLGIRDRVESPPRDARISTTHVPQPVVFVVIDGLRADTARDPLVMPFLRSLSDIGGRGIARVECLIPSSVAAIETFTTGRVPAPASFLTDFVAPPDARGGLIADVERTGGNVFVAGPSLWTDKYGRWIDASNVDHTFGSADASLLASALAQLRGSHPALIIVHFGRVDRAAHRTGATSDEYRDAARWCDDALRQIVRAMPHEASIIVTSDHGNRDAGGHAGLESSVVETPVVMRGNALPIGNLGHLRQRDVHRLLASVLGLSGAFETYPANGVRSRDRSGILAASLVTLLCLSVLSALHAGLNRPALIAFPLNTTVWISIALIVAGDSTRAAWMSTTALGAAAIWCRIRLSGRVTTAFVVGGVVGVVRVFDTFRRNDFGELYEIAAQGLALLIVASTAIGGAVVSYRSRGRNTESLVAMSFVLAAVGWLTGGLALTIIAAASVFCGRSLAAVVIARKSTTLSGALTLVVAVLLARLDGNTLSLSTIEVRTAFTVVEWRFGIALAGMVAVLAQALPIIGLLIGLFPALSSSTASGVGAFAAGLAACVVGQAVVSSEIFSVARSAYPESLALGLLLRVAAEAMYAFLGLAMLAVCFAGVQRLRVRRPSPFPVLR